MHAAHSCSPLLAVLSPGHAQGVPEGVACLSCLLAFLAQVPVMQSDLSFSLLYGSNLPEALIRAVPALLAEFPAGLLTPAGTLLRCCCQWPLPVWQRYQCCGCSAFEATCALRKVTKVDGWLRGRVYLGDGFIGYH